MSLHDCMNHEDYPPDKPCSCYYCHGKGDSPDCEFRNHDCDNCRDLAASCPSFRAWFAARNVSAIPQESTERGEG